MTKKYWVITSTIILVIIVFLEIYIRHDHPSFFEDTIEHYQKDKELMSSIGGYESFEYEFNKNELKEDTLNFKITLIGREKNILLSGKAVKDQENKWMVVEKEIVLKDDN